MGSQVGDFGPYLERQGITLRVTGTPDNVDASHCRERGHMRNRLNIAPPKSQQPGNNALSLDALMRMPAADLELRGQILMALR